MNYVALLLIGIVIGAAAMYIKPPGGVASRSAPKWIMIPVPGQTQNAAAWKLNTSSGDAYLCQLSSTSKASCIQAPDAPTS